MKVPASARARCRLPPPGLAGLDGDGQQQSGDRIDRPKAAEDAGADREADAAAEQRAGRRRWPRIFLERAHQAEHQDRHRGCERRVLGVHIHVPVIERAGGEQHERQQPGDRPADPAAEPPGHRETDEADHRAGEPARLEQIEGQNLGEERGRHVEAAPIGIQVDEGQRPSIGESGAEQVEQQRAVLGVGVVVPAEAVIPERQGGNDGDGDEHRDGQAVGDRLRRPPPRRRYGHGCPGCLCCGAGLARPAAATVGGSVMSLPSLGVPAIDLRRQYVRQAERRCARSDRANRRLQGPCDGCPAMRAGVNALFGRRLE